MQPQTLIILGIYMVLEFTSKAAQLWGDPSLIHTLWTQWCWVAHLCSYNTQWWFQHTSTFGPKVPLAPKAPLARKLKYVEITIANLQKWEAKQLTGDVFPKKHVVRHLQTCPVFLAPRQPAKVLIVQVYDIWIVFCTGEIFLTGQLI